MNSNAEIVVTLGAFKDAQVILDLSRALNYQHREKMDQGFLVIEFSLENVIKLIKSESIYVATRDNMICGYIIGEDWSAPENADVREHFALMESPEVDLAKIARLRLLHQIAVSPAQSRAGVGSALYRQLFREFPDFAFVGCIVTKPYLNLASINLIEKMGFEKIGTIQIDKFLGLSPYESSVFLRR